MNLKDFIRSIPDYPKKGILFRDITTLIKNEKAFSTCIDQIVERSKKFNSKRFKANLIEAAEQCDFNNIPEVREPETT